jgi:hypothetical protein
MAIFILKEAFLLIDCETRPRKAQFVISSLSRCLKLESWREREREREINSALVPNPPKETGFSASLFSLTLYTQMTGRDREMRKKREYIVAES